MMFKVNDLVRFYGHEGIVLDVRIVRGNGLFKDYVLYRVQFPDKPIEWINGFYLYKVV